MTLVEEVLLLAYGPPKHPARKDPKSPKDSKEAKATAPGVALQIHNVHTGGLLTQCKGFDYGVGMAQLVGGLGSGATKGVLAVGAAEQHSALGAVWSWQREAVQQKLHIPVRLTTTAVSPSGQYLVGGSTDGSIHVWDLPSGALLQTAPAGAGHFGRVGVAAWFSDNSAFATGDDAGRVCVWVLDRFLCPARAGERSAAESGLDAGDGPAPVRAWHEHRQPVTDLWIGVGACSHARIFSASLDRTVRVWQTQFSTPLAVLLFAAPALAATCNLTESHVYAGTRDGAVLSAPLYRFAAARSGRSRAMPVDTVAAPEGGGGVASDGAGLAVTRWVPWPAERGAPAAITTLSLNFDGSVLVAGNALGEAVSLQAQTGQVLRRFAAPAAVTAANWGVSSAAIFLRPPEMLHPQAHKFPGVQVQPLRRHPVAALAAVQSAREVTDAAAGVSLTRGAPHVLRVWAHADSDGFTVESSDEDDTWSDRDAAGAAVLVRQLSQGFCDTTAGAPLCSDALYQESREVKEKHARYVDVAARLYELAASAAFPSDR